RSFPGEGRVEDPVVIKLFLSGAAAAALLTASGAAAAVRAEAPAWVVTPATDSCRTEIELTGASGATVPVALVSNGEGVNLIFAKADAPERAFLPIRIDHKPYANLVVRQADGKGAAMQLSSETLTALRKGGVLQVGWLADEPVQAPLAGSEQGLADLRTCGGQVAARFRDQQATQRDAQARAESDARAKAISDEQLAAARAQKQAAEAETQRNAAEAGRLQAAADAESRRAAEQAAQQDAYPYARAGGYGDPRGAYYPQDPYQPYDPPNPYRRW
ncbi:MAG: hypothetical protein JWQ97_1454, partial [Phenylobacterium sp.]|nr:hypothetical protein [Phenylobacterium sp.]